jgi:pimeloyl-ACP methyl ester carboxylesterase
MTETRSGAFADLVASPDTHVVLDLDQPGRSLLILFGGIAGGVSMPVFEFFRMTADYPAKKAFLRDPRRGWYQLGLPGVGDTAADVRRLLDDIIAHSGAERVVMAGASAGGFAALLFGTWCGVNEVIAFSPQTFIDAENRASAGDVRWPDQIAHLHAMMPSRAATLDLLPILPETPGPTRYQVHVSDDDPLDLLHAERIAARGGVEFIVHTRGGHRLVKTLRDQGLLRPLLLDALNR